MSERCSARVHDDFGVSFHGCSRTGKVQRDGKWWCKTHDPKVKADRDKAWREAFDAKIAEDDRIKSEGDALAKRLGAGSTYYDGVSRKGGLRRALVVPFDVIEKLLTELGR